jgi:HEPN domain-containing protein
MADKHSLTRGWFLKAESDLSAARRILEGEGPYDTACFHLQQAAEKFRKGFLAFHDQPIPHTHNVEDLA